MSNGIGKNPLTDISKVYIETIRESYKIEPPKEKLKTDRNMFNIPKDEQQAAKERLLAKTKAKRAKMKEALDPCLLYTSPSPRDVEESRMPSSA